MKCEIKKILDGGTHRERECRITVSGRLSRPRAAWVSAFAGAPYRGATETTTAPPSHRTRIDTKLCDVE